jgi:nucleotide-binding universal stress UspA family protein
MDKLVQNAPVRNRFGPARAAWRTLLVHVQPEAAAEPRLIAAADLATKLDATLVGLGAEMLQAIGMSDPTGMLGAEFMTAMGGVIQANLKKAQQNFKLRAPVTGVQWLSVEDFPVNAICRLARAADLIVVGGSPLDAHDNYRWCDPAEVAIQSGRPVLVVPPGGGALQAKAVVVAWKDSRESRRALADSLPVLKCAEKVLILGVCEKDEVVDTKIHTASVVEFLLRHGVDARAKVIAAPNAEVSGHLQAEAKAIGADLIVAGAYGHSRLGEWVFGGVTFDLLHDPQRFLLLSH